MPVIFTCSELPRWICGCEVLAIYASDPLPWFAWSRPGLPGRYDRIFSLQNLSVRILFMVKSYRSWVTPILSLPEREVESSNKRSSRSIGRSRYGVKKEINPTFIISHLFGALVAPGRETSNSSPRALDIYLVTPWIPATLIWIWIWRFTFPGNQ